VRDTTPPSLTAPADVVAEATSAAGAVVTYPAASATDAVGPVTVVYSAPSGSLFALGVTTVTVTARDGAGNTTRRTFTVTVRDTTAPVIVVSSPADGATIGTDQTVTFAYTATDAVGVTSRSATLDGVAISSGTVLDGSKLTPGTHTIVVTAADAAGNSSTITVKITVTAIATIQTLFTEVLRGFVTRKIDPVLAVSLTVKLTHALTMESLGRVKEAANDVKAFVNEVKAQRGKKIDAAEADKLIALGNAVIAALLASNL